MPPFNNRGATAAGSAPSPIGIGEHSPGSAGLRSAMVAAMHAGDPAVRVRAREAAVERELDAAFHLNFSRGGLAGPAGPRDYAGPGGRLGALLELGVIRLVRADALLELAGHRLVEGEDRPGGEDGRMEYEREPSGECGRIMRRQDAPDSMFHPGATAVKLWRQSRGRVAPRSEGGAGQDAAGLWLHAVSYCWISPEHPDPDGFHLGRLAKVLATLRRARQCYKNDTPPLDAGVFWDFVSLPQAHGGGRTALEARQMRLALANMQLLYGHAHTVVLKLTAMPPAPAPLGPDRRFVVVTADGRRLSLAWEYADRGWPCFESCVADASSVVFGSRLEFGAGLGLLGGVRTVYELTRHFRAKGRPPVHPRRFAEQLDAKAFTNGADRGMVTALYGQTFRSMAEAEAVDLARAGLGGDPETMGLLYEALADFRRLRSLSLSSNQLQSVPAELGSLAALQTLYLNNNQLTSVPAELGSLKKLQELDLSKNQLTSVPAELGSLKKLQELDLSNNQLTSVPAELGSLVALETLNLYKNQLTSVPAEVEALQACRGF